ncbi:hypothetical protein [Acinetobacter sp. CFCC 10889]|uniref:hypothetical protein n=1 Tax=Acinetobacter sp. CFCC 10889 TaxID=1775557 RepID=UPI000DD06703|nr:hypothetical protein [Acinetobacter sp. CFCC 10889]
MYSIYSGTEPFEKYELEFQFEIEQEMYAQLFIHNPLLKEDDCIRVEFYIDEEERTLTFFNAEIDLINHIFFKVYSIRSTFF